MHFVAKRRGSLLTLFGLLVFTALQTCLAEATGNSALEPNRDEVDSSPLSADASLPSIDPSEQKNSGSDYDTQVQAEKAYKQASQVIAAIGSYQPPQAQAYTDLQSTSLFAQLFPNQQGPVASAVRIILKLRQQSWMPSFLSSRFGKDGWSIGKKKGDMGAKVVKAVDLLEHAVELGHMDALYKLAQVSMFHPSPLLHNVTRAFEAYQQHAYLTGNGTSQAMLAFFYSSGFEDLVEVDQAKALLHYTFAAHSGDQGAQMALGYRHWAGIGVNDDCLQSLDWYQMAAEQSMVKYLSGPPGGRTLPLTTTRLADLDGGAYGPGSSVASTGPNAQRAVIKAASARQAGETWEDVLEYYMFNAERGETDFAYRLGKIFYQGSIYASAGGIASGAEGVGAIPRDYQRARYHFLRIARIIWPRDAPSSQAITVKQEHREDGTLAYAAASAGYLGRMYLRGEGVKQDFALAKLWFDRGAEYKDKECFNGLGIMWRDGLIDGKKDMKKSVQYFGIAANQELAEAQVNLGKYYYHNGDYKLATTYFEAAIRHGSPFEPYFYLAEIHAAQVRSPATLPHHVQASCSMAVGFYKRVAERGSWGDDAVREGELKWKIGTEQAKEDALLRWWIASERGIETAQNNLAYILDQDKSILRWTRFAPNVPSNSTARLALTQWMRSATQRNIDALVKVGDYYYHGLGVPDEPQELRWEKAASYYQAAADTQVSALAMWNLGWMYENGVGVPQDFHLAKRHYDMALQTNSEAYLPATLSLMKLYARSIWHTMTGGKNGLSFWPDEEKLKEDKALEGEQDTETLDHAEGSDDNYPEETDDSQWYRGKAREDHKKRLRAAEGRLREEEDPIQWARDRRNAENDRDSDFGPEDYFEGAMRNGRRDEEMLDDLAETMVLVFLCLVISTLLYVRNRWVERRRREEEERRGGRNRNDGGLFPPPGDPARREWNVLR